MNCWNSVSKLNTSSHKNNVNDNIGSNVVENQKCFWSYVKLKRTDNISVPTFKTGTKVCNSDIDKAVTHNKHWLVEYGLSEEFEVSGNALKICAVVFLQL